MKRPENPHRRQTFVHFLDALVSDDAYAGVVAALREVPMDDFHEDMRWHAVEPLLADIPAGLEALRGFAAEDWDPAFGPFSAGNLKARYIPDEEFVNGGRAFVLFNLVASNWTHVSHVANQAAHWKRTTP
jgi:hypothetical protein